jgi:hypothetical protein
MWPVLYLSSRKRWNVCLQLTFDGSVHKILLQVAVYSLIY